MDALIGFNGFVGSNLLSQLKEKPELFNSSNIESIRFKHYGNLYLCCPFGTKYIVNRESSKDLANILNLLAILATVDCNTCYLVSSQDCNSSSTSDESFSGKPITPYGTNRLFFEEAVRDLFCEHHVLRIGCLFGKGLKKNIIYDLLNNNYLENLTEDYSFQLYNMNNLLCDLEMLHKYNIPLSNRFSEPVYVSELIELFNECGYNYKFKLTRNDDKSYRNEGLLYSKKQMMNDLKQFIRNYGK